MLEDIAFHLKQRACYFSASARACPRVRVCSCVWARAVWWCGMRDTYVYIANHTTCVYQVIDIITDFGPGMYLGAGTLVVTSSTQTNGAYISPRVMALAYGSETTLFPLDPYSSPFIYARDMNRASKNKTCSISCVRVCVCVVWSCRADAYVTCMPLLIGKPLIAYRYPRRRSVSNAISESIIQRRALDPAALAFTIWLCDVRLIGSVILSFFSRLRHKKIDQAARYRP